MTASNESVKPDELDIAGLWLPVDFVNYPGCCLGFKVVMNLALDRWDVEIWPSELVAPFPSVKELMEWLAAQRFDNRPYSKASADEEGFYHLRRLALAFNELWGS